MAACRAPDPGTYAPAPWLTIGKGPAGYTALDTARIEVDGSGRVVWLRTDYLAADSAPKVPGTMVAVRETRHRVECGARTVGDLETVLRDDAEKPVRQDPAPGAAPRPFDAHPYGKKVFPTVCNAISMAAEHRKRGR